MYVCMKSLFAKTDNSDNNFHFQKSYFLLCYGFIVLVSCIFLFFLPNQNNPSAVWIESNEKT